MKKLTLAAVALLAILVVVVVVRAVLFTASAITSSPLAVPPDSAAVQRLAAAVRIRTISYTEPTARDTQAFAALHAHLRSSFPCVHQAMRLSRVAGYSLLYTWPGTDSSLAPILLLGHQDVVPVEEATRSQWTHDPFGGVLHQGYLYGRGTLDDKVNIYGQFEAAEALLASGFVPRRTLYFAFGHDEEVLGSGAIAMARLLQARGVRAQFVLDEGMIVGQGFLPVVAPLAFVGLAEKGYVSYRLTVNAIGGHSSYPRPDNAVAILAAAVARVNEQQMPTRLTGPVQGLLDAVGPHMDLTTRLAVANRWLLSSVLLDQFTQSNTSNAMVRTTTAPTVFTSGVKENVMPNQATAIINYRLLPGDGLADVTAHLQAAIADDRVQVQQLDGYEASPVSSTTSDGYAVISQAIRQTFPDAIVAPSLVIGATDARHYAIVADDVYRFMPVRMTPDDTPRIHGIDERIHVLQYAECIRFYKTLMQVAAH